MADLALSHAAIGPMSADAIGTVRHLESIAATLPQVPIRTDHVLHAGLYARTVIVPAGAMITGVQIKRATLLIVSGSAIAYVGGEPLHLDGFNVLPASAGRKQAFVARADTHLTMIFPTAARTIEEAERAFTDEYDLLASHRDASCNTVRITGE